MPAGFDPDPTKRLIFSHVFIRVLKEAIKFTPYGETPVLVKQSPLCEVSCSPMYHVSHRLLTSVKQLVKGPDVSTVDFLSGYFAHCALDGFGT